MRFWFQLGSGAVLLMFLTGLGVPLAGQSEAEEELRSAALLAFVQNTHWRDPMAANAPITVGVWGRAGFVRRLRSGLDGKVVEGHPLRALEVTGAVDPGCCQVFYFALNKPEQVGPALQAVNSAHVLTVGEADRFLELGGAVNLFLEDGHMAFEVSLGALERAGIEISSKLLRFGQIRDRGKGRRK